MRPIGFGIVAALLIAVLAPATVYSAKKPEPAVNEKVRAQGMLDTPPLVQQLGLNCQISDARFIGKSEDKKAKTSQSYYEVACTGAMGFILQSSTAGTPPTAFTCVEANTPAAPGQPAALPCILPGNSDPKAQLTPLLVKAGAANCVPIATRGIGQSKTATYLEVNCQDGSGFVIVASSPFDGAKEVTAQNCLAYDDAGGNIRCTLAEPAARLAIVDSYAKAANNNCAVTGRRFVGQAKNGSNYFEASCQDGKGYIYQVNEKGALVSATDCAKALGILGGCTLTDSREAATEQAGLYTRLAKDSGYACDVDKYAIFPAPAGKDVVELVCKSGQGGIAIFPATGKGVVYDCGHALVAGYRCGLNKTESGYAALTADLKKFNLNSCDVSNSRLVGKTAKGTLLLEVACADKLKGYVIEYNAEPVTALGATGCAFAGTCKLPGNV